MRQAALEWDPRSLLLLVDGRTQAFLVPEQSTEEPGRTRLREGVHSMLEAACAAPPEAGIRAVVGDRIPSGERLPAVVGQLRRLARYARDREAYEVVWAGRHSLARLLATLDPRRASDFVDGQLAELRAYDREHGTNLQRVLELALDHDNRNTAARAAFMHRNTFRRQLHKALQLIEVDLACPEERLALHVALKMRALGRVPPSAVRRK